MKMKQFIIIGSILIVLLIGCSWQNPFQLGWNINTITTGTTTTTSGGTTTSSTTTTTISTINPVTNLTACKGFNQVCLKWANPADANFSGVRIQRSFTTFPTTISDGVTVYTGGATLYIDSSDKTSDVHYYTIFAYNTDSVFSTPVTVSSQPVDNKWFVDFEEYSNNPIVSDPAEKRYYPSVIYDANAFGNAIGDDINGDLTGDETYTKTPYYKMWVGNGSDTYFLYSDDGINWISSTIGNNIITGHYHPTVIYNAGSVKYRMWNWDLIGGKNLDYFYSVDGVHWIADTSGDLKPGDSEHLGAPYITNTAPLYSINILYENGKYNAFVNNNGFYHRISTTTPEDGSSWYNHGLLQLDSSNFGSIDGCLFIIHKDNKYECWYNSALDGSLPGGASAALSYCESADTLDNTGDILNFISVDDIDYKGINGTHAGPASNGILKNTDGKEWRDKKTYIANTILYSPTKFDEHGESKDYKMYFTGESNNTVLYPKRGIGYVSFNDVCK